MELFLIVVCKAIIIAVLLFVISLVVGAWYVFIKGNIGPLILKIIIFFGLVTVSLLAVIFVVKVTEAFLFGSIIV